MGINNTGDIYKGFVIGEEGQPGRLYSTAYGVYITGEGVYNAPERDAEMVVIPGRNGSFYKDNKRFNNTILTYKAGMFGNDQTDFAEGIKNFRNAMALRQGYYKLYDDYNPDEFRMAVYKGGLDINPVSMSKAGTFDITFECKPQRYLKTGDTYYSITNNQSLTNQGKFPCYPLISFSASGSGTIGIGSQTIQVINEAIGNTPLSLTKSVMSYNGSSYYETITINNPGVMNNGDAFTVRGASGYIRDLADSNVTSLSYASGQGLAYGGYSISSKYIDYQLSDDAGATFTKGTSATVTKTASAVISQTGYSDATQNITLTLSYNGSSTITVSWTVSSPSHVLLRVVESLSNYFGTAASTISALAGATVYIDLEIGEAYKLINGLPVSVNNYVNLGSIIPNLSTGTSTITYSNTITNFKMKPRWFII